MNGTLANAYLHSRGITITPPPSLRFHPALKHGPTGLLLPAMVAAVQNVTGQVVAIHRTFIRAHGAGKAGVTQPKMALGSTGGNAVRLARADDAIVLVEGIEDGLSLQQMTGAPCWAVLGTSGFLNIELPERIRRVALAPDSDPAGRAALERAGNRLSDRGLTVEFALPPEGRDWNDILADYGERAAIAEHDGALSTEEAEALARLQVFGGAA